MTEWEVVGVLVVVVGLVTAIVTPLIKLNTTVTKLVVMVDNLGKTIDELTRRNSEAHSRVFKQLDDHETRLISLEQRRN